MAGPWDKFKPSASVSAQGPWQKYSQPEQTPPSPVQDVTPDKSEPYEGWGEYLRDLGRSAAQGATLGFGDEITAGVRSVLPESIGGADYDTAVKQERDAINRFGREHPVASITSQLGAGLAIPAGPLATALKAPTLLGKTVRSAGVGSGIGAVAGFGGGEGGVSERLPSAGSGAVAGAAFGAAAPAVLQGASNAASAAHRIVSPQIARYGANARAALRKAGFEASADGGLPPNPGAEAAAEQIIANQLYRAGKTPDELRDILVEAQNARKFHSSGVAQEVLAPVDLDPSLQRLAGSAARSSPEAANIGQSFMHARQTGMTPHTPLSDEAGLPTRPMMSQPMTGAQAEKQFGRNFDTPADKIVPMGQMERIRDALKRSFLIRDEEFHGHGGNAYRTEQSMIKSLKEEANKLYPKAWKEAENFDLTVPFNNLRVMQNEINDPGVHTVFNRAMRLFTNPTGNGAPLSAAVDLRRFDLAKQRLDGLIDKAKGNDTFLYRALTGFKNDVLDAVHGGNRMAPTRNRAYGDARGYYSSQKEAQEAIALGRSAFKDDSDIGADVFRSLETPGLQKLFRLGVLSGVEAKAKSMPRGTDITKMFDNPRIQELLSAVIPRSQAKADTFANRPERFGQYLANEKRMIQTRDEVLGNSKTAQRLADDEAFEGLSGLSGAVEKFRNSGSLTMLGVKYAEHVLSKFFGMRADTSAAMARQLFTADPIQREMLLARLRTRMGDSRFAHFTKLMQQYESTVAPGSIVSGTSAGSPSP